MRFSWLDGKTRSGDFTFPTHIAANGAALLLSFSPMHGFSSPSKHQNVVILLLAKVFAKPLAFALGISQHA
jgi:hypothetical protein